MDDRRKSDRRDQDYLMSDGQVAELAGVSINTVRFWRQIGLLPFIKVGRHPRLWYSSFQKVFQKPLSFWEGGADKMPSTGDIRRML